MNQTFYFPRWWMLVTRHWAENRRRFLLSLLAIAGLLLAWYGFEFIMDRAGPLHIAHQAVTYHIGLFVAGCIYASTIFSPLGNKKEAIQYLSVPASQLEKFLCALFYAVVIFFILYTLVFYLVDIPMVKISARSISVWDFDQMPASNSKTYGIINVFTNSGSFANEVKEPVFLLAFLAIQSAFILGSVYFNRFAFIKTLIALLTLILLCVLFVAKVVAGNLPKGWGLGSLLEWTQFVGDGQMRVISSASWLESSLIFLVEYSIPFVLWYIAYIRLKEKEV